MDRVNKGLKRRYRAERRFRTFGATAIFAALIFLFLLFFSIISSGYKAFQQTYMRLDVYFDPAQFTNENLATADFPGLIRTSLLNRFPEVTSRNDKKDLYYLVSPGASFQLMDLVKNDPALIGTTRTIWVTANDDVDMLLKGNIDRNSPANERRIKDKQLVWLDALASGGEIEKRFNTNFFTAGDSREPELAGIWGATCGSFYTLLITLSLSFPIGVAAAVYLEEFAPKNKWTDIIEVNINNLAAVPSIVFGLLGLAVYINFFGMPRSTPLVGG
ncbi:MAG: DUF3333 domain-containing protein, partial [Deltaproteobacteria bacterium]|nr:DUF3333 domain-containing protein [Deltaproteobacteria bacterium]